MDPVRSRIRSLRRYRCIDLLADLIRSPQQRTFWFLRLLRPANLFQPFSETWPDRYPEIFRFVRDELGDGPEIRLLSFGCSTGAEVLSLRRYFPAAFIKGLDINPLNVAACLWRQRETGDQRVSFAVAGSVEEESDASYDAVFCMAVLRHGHLSWSNPRRCDHRITFEAFERTVRDLARCVKDGGLLIIQHSNFRFCDSEVAADFRAVLTVNNGGRGPRNPEFGPDNRRLSEPPYGEVVFQKGRAGLTTLSSVRPV